MANREPLTPAQQKWAAQYLPLARSLAKKYKFDDVTVFYEAICKAARGYDESKGYTFRALLTRACHNAAIDMWRKKADPLVVGCKPEQLEVSEVQPIVNTSWMPPPDVPERKIRAPGMSVRSIQRRAKEQGWAAKPGRPRVLDDATVLKLLLAGKSQADAQRALGVCVRTVRDRCAKTRQTLKVLRSSRKRIDKRAKIVDGDKMHRMITLTPEQIAAAQNMRDHGVPWRELAANMLLRFGVKASHQFWWNNVPRGPADKRKRRATK
jgi:DNA-directed RNA polymerase specialized sigma24 family protein